VGENIQTLLIAPDGELCRVPFEALLLEDVAEGAAPAHWPFLIQQYGVAYVHSGTALREQVLFAREKEREKPQGLPRFVGFGHPYYPKAERDLPELAFAVPDRRGFQPLPKTAEEVLGIARLFAEGEEEARCLEEASKAMDADPDSRSIKELSGKRFTLFLREGASEAALKQRAEVKAATVLHLACHGQADLTSPALSHLTLAQSREIEAVTHEDGFVTLHELRDLGLDAELVVLSACETNAGTLRPFEGIAGLSRAALAGGAHSVLSTLWSVQDRAAREMMEWFYTHWIEDKLSKIEALAKAKRRAIAEGSPLGTWAAYTLWATGQ
jgi:CHAT domain-containing protein